MTKIELIIKTIDEYLEKTGMHEISAVEANALLADKSVLWDSADRPGLPLRKRLRNGELPHAYQLANKRWFIPHS